MEATEEGRIRTGTLWTGTAHAFTAIVGSGILALPWSVAQLGWILGPLVLVTFAIVTYYTSIIFSDCYRTPDPVTGRRNHTYGDAVRTLLGPTEGYRPSTKIWHAFQALGNIAFAFGYSNILLEIQDTLKSPPPENKVMKKVTLYAIGATTLFYISLGCMGYVAYGNDVPGNVLAGFYNIFWLVDIANLAVIIHLIGAYQVYSQPIFAIHEKWIVTRWPTSFFSTVYTVKLPFIKKYTIRFTLSKLLLRTVFVIFTTAIAMMFPFFNAILGLLGAVSFWPLTVYLPMSMYIVQAKIKRGSSKWIMFQILGLSCLIVTLVAAIGSIADILELLKNAKLFHIQL
ncbi:hypothetical protein Patl1_07896 [Pistacia atlantica]|uniref:Uncharacterized protein n=1 Tax=Pistacia atlantica TaxID=434234 RepID=A0ACC1AEG7_9ROSI|nr:hypothetical protein Patl1_07896 [Pistacia atlantica]